MPQKHQWGVTVPSTPRLCHHPGGSSGAGCLSSPHCLCLCLCLSLSRARNGVGKAREKESEEGKALPSGSEGSLVPLDLQGGRRTKNSGSRSQTLCQEAERRRWPAPALLERDTVPSVERLVYDGATVQVTWTLPVSHGRQDQAGRAGTEMPLSVPPQDPACDEDLVVQRLLSLSAHWQARQLRVGGSSCLGNRIRPKEGP